MECLRQQWNNACLAIGIPSLTVSTSAKIMAILLHYGNNEAMVLSPHFRADCEYIQKRFHIQGGEIPDEEFAHELRIYNQELEQRGMFAKPPQWAVDLMKNMYNINIY